MADVGLLFAGVVDILGVLFVEGIVGQMDECHVEVLLGWLLVFSCGETGETLFIKI